MTPCHRIMWRRVFSSDQTAMTKLNLLVAILILVGLTLDAAAQKVKPAPVCRQVTFAAFKPLPKLEYACPDGLIDSDDEILKLTARTAAIRRLEGALESFTGVAWWDASVDDLNACEIHGRVGELTNEENERVKQGDYSFQLFGNHQIRLVLLADSCYQTGYAGANAFLLYRRDGRVFVTQVLNGYYSRVDNSVGIDFAKLNTQQLVEVSTANSFPPSLWYLYFVIEPKTNKAVPKKIFKDGNKLTNEIYSAMLMGKPKDLGLPKDASELSIIRNGRLAPTFSAYEESDRGKIDANGRKLRRIVYRWNGRVYLRSTVRKP
jgi:hypothetical protein